MSKIKTKEGLAGPDWIIATPDQLEALEKSGRAPGGQRTDRARLLRPRAPGLGQTANTARDPSPNRDLRNSTTVRRTALGRRQAGNDGGSDRDSERLLQKGFHANRG